MPRLEDVDIPDLPPGYMPLEIVAVIKCFDEAGEPTIAVRSSTGIMAWEALGMLIAASDMTRADLQADFSTVDVPIEPPEEDDNSRE
jgi:hypothetical protein